MGEREKERKRERKCCHHPLARGHLPLQAPDPRLRGRQRLLLGLTSVCSMCEQFVRVFVCLCACVCVCVCVYSRVCVHSCVCALSVRSVVQACWMAWPPSPSSSRIVAAECVYGMCVCVPAMTSRPPPPCPPFPPFPPLPPFPPFPPLPPRPPRTPDLLGVGTSSERAAFLLASNPSRSCLAWASAFTHSALNSISLSSKRYLRVVVWWLCFCFWFGLFVLFGLFFWFWFLFECVFACVLACDWVSK